MSKKSIFAASIALALMSFNAAAEPVSSDYPGPWEWDFHFQLTRALTVNEVTGCGAFKYRVSKSDSSEFLVYCSSDLKNWKAYRVWPNRERVRGPYKSDPALL